MKYWELTPIALINLISVLPGIIPLLFPINLSALRMIRLFRIFRLLKLTKYSNSLKTLTRALDSRKEQLIMTCVIIGLFVVIASIFIFYAENGENPSPAFADIPHTLWWSFVKLSPISTEPGTPITMWGKVVVSFLAILEIGIFAIPAGIMASAFDEQWKSDRAAREQLKECKRELRAVKRGVCPHCNGVLEEGHEAE